MTIREALREQMVVWDAEGERVGTISALGERRFFIAHDPSLHEHEATLADVLEVREGECFLNVPRRALRRAGPPGSEAPDETPFYYPAPESAEP